MAESFTPERSIQDEFQEIVASNFNEIPTLYDALGDDGVAGSGVMEKSQEPMMQTIASSPTSSNGYTDYDYD